MEDSQAYQAAMRIMLLIAKRTAAHEDYLVYELRDIILDCAAQEEDNDV